MGLQKREDDLKGGNVAQSDIKYGRIAENLTLCRRKVLPWLVVGVHPMKASSHLLLVDRGPLALSFAVKTGQLARVPRQNK